MTQKNKSISNTATYYVSPGGKIHANSCRYCQSQKDGWQKLDSFSDGVNQGYQTCRLCCPSESEVKATPKTEKVLEEREAKFQRIKAQYQAGTYVMPSSEVLAEKVVQGILDEIELYK